MQRVRETDRSRGVGAAIGAAGLLIAVAIGDSSAASAWAEPLPVAGKRAIGADRPIAAVKAARRPGCTRHSGRGYAPTEHFARLKAWEMVAQATGNWPFQTDEFRSSHYRCYPDRQGRSCLVAVDVCRKV